MKISSKVTYGIISIVDIVLNSKNKVCNLKEISKRQNISLKYLEQIFCTLKRKKIVKSIKGAQGGYVLLKNPEEITLFMLFNILSNECSLENRAEEISGSIKDIFEKKYLFEMQKVLDDYTKNITIYEIVNSFYNS